MNETKGAYLGLDINSKNTVLSIYKSNMDEPTTVSTVLGEENYAIPTVLAKRIGMGQWFFGDEAILKARVKEAVLIEDLFNRALRNEEIFVDSETYLARDLLVIFFNKLFSIPGPMAAMGEIEKLVICVEQVKLDVMELMNYVTGKLGIDSKKVMLIDRNECFYLLWNEWCF